MSRIVLDTKKAPSTVRVYNMPERVIKVPFAKSTTEKKTGITLKSGLWLSDVFLNVTTAAGSSTIDVGLDATSGIFDNPDGLINGASCAATGYKYRDTLVSQLLPGNIGPGGNYVNTSAGLAIGGTATDVKTANAIVYAVNGVRCAKAATDDLWDLTGLDTTGGTKYNGAFLYLDASGTASIVAATEGASAGAIVWPDPVVANKCCIGSIVVNEDSGAFTGGTSSLSDAEVVTFTNAVSGTNDQTFGLSPTMGLDGFGLRLTSDVEITYTTSDHTVAGFFYIVVKGGFE